MQSSVRSDSTTEPRVNFNTRRWLASKWHGETYGEQPQAQVTVNVNTLHLDALRMGQAQEKRKGD